MNTSFPAHLSLFICVVLCYNSHISAQLNATDNDEDILGISSAESNSCPLVHCTGRDCAFVTELNGCQTCACPIGTAARGCDRMPKRMWADLMLGGCPTAKTLLPRRKSQKVIRYHRYIDRRRKIDECRSYVYPYCGVQAEQRHWRSPRTREECLEYCYSYQELKQLG